MDDLRFKVSGTGPGVVLLDIDMPAMGDFIDFRGGQNFGGRIPPVHKEFFDRIAENGKSKENYRRGLRCIGTGLPSPSPWGSAFLITMGQLVNLCFSKFLE